MEESEFHHLRSKTLYLLTSILSLGFDKANMRSIEVIVCWLFDKKPGVQHLKEGWLDLQ